MAVSRGVIVDGLIPHLWVVELAVQPLTETIELSEIQRTEVKKEIPVNELCVDGEEVATRVLRWRCAAQSDIVQSVL